MGWLERDRGTVNMKRRPGKNFAKAEFGKVLIEKCLANVKERGEVRLKREAQLEERIPLSEEGKDRIRKLWSREDVCKVFTQMQNVSLSDFEELQTLGTGSFGTVSLVQYARDGCIYAMKKLSKREMLRRDQVSRVWLERSILVALQNSGCSLHFAFQDEENLYMVMEFLQGGDLLGLLSREVTVSEDFVARTGAELVLAVERLHKHGIIHRDVKPDNILFAEDGHLALADFGLSKALRLCRPAVSKAVRRATFALEPSLPQAEDYWTRRGAWRKLSRRQKFSTVGTPDYIAPEVLAGDAYSEDCDWWSVGCVLYEMLIGHPPFCSITPEDVCHRVLNWETYLTFPSEMAVSDEARDLIIKLLCGRNSRLGSSGVEEIKKHPFFRNINWDTILGEEPPFVPQLSSRVDLKYFDLPEEEESDRQKRDFCETTRGSSQLSTNSEDRDLSCSPLSSPSCSMQSRRGSFRKELETWKVKESDVQFAGFTYKRFKEEEKKNLVDLFDKISLSDEDQQQVESPTLKIA
ncbi:hypothetical protein NDN08_002562 [Rhodosorus marinus]|uniref:non-specific serine/threonine protein kinase n=1 Tax=Rhodosorus marinus TaxID=101924 RepID=A0AAV8UU51_9RHOD|nr:hypothetical protein NDN08_002562 [Rhodosorus marinus]